MLTIAKRDYELSSGEIISIGMNFKALELMSRFPGGLNKLKKDMDSLALLDEESDELGEGMVKALEAMAFMLHSLISAGGTKCTMDEALMAISPVDFAQLSAIFEEFNEAMSSIAQKKTPMRGRKVT